MNTWYAYLGWVVAAGAVGFAISMIFAGVLRLLRNLFSCSRTLDYRLCSCMPISAGVDCPLVNSFGTIGCGD